MSLDVPQHNERQIAKGSDNRPTDHLLASTQHPGKDRLTPETQSLTDATRGVLDPPGSTPFGLNVPHDSLIPNRVKQPPVIKPMSQSTVENSGHVKNYSDGKGTIINYKLDDSGRLSVKTEIGPDGARDVTKFNEKGRPTSETLTIYTGDGVTTTKLKTKNELAVSTKAPDGSSTVTDFMDNQSTKMTIDPQGKVSAVENDTESGSGKDKKIDQHLVQYNNEGLPSLELDAKYENGNRTDIHLRTLGEDQTIKYGPGEQFQSTTTSQYMDLMPGITKPVLDPSSERTDAVTGNADGTHDITTNFYSRPGVSFQTHIERNGDYDTNKRDDETGTVTPYEKGKGPTRLRV